MKWTKLEYGKYPKGKIVVRFDVIPGPAYEIGYIDKNSLNNEWYLYCDKPMPSKMSIDSIYDLEPHYISLNEIQLP